MLSKWNWILKNSKKLAGLLDLLIPLALYASLKAGINWLSYTLIGLVFLARLLVTCKA